MKENLYEEIKAALKKSQKKVKKYIDRNRKEIVKYKVGVRSENKGLQFYFILFYILHFLFKLFYIFYF